MTEVLDPKALLAVYDAQLRARDLPPAGSGFSAEWDGPVLRAWGGTGGGFLEYRDLGGLEGDELDAFIARQVAFYTERDEKFEWKTRGHDQPADLPQRLIAAGFEAEERETVLIGLAAPLADRNPSLEGIAIRRTTDPVDFAQMAANKSIVWGHDMSWIVDMLLADSQSEDTIIYGAEADGQIVSSAWIRFVPGTDFAGLWGGDTLPAYRKRGIYRALVAVRAADAIDRGYKYLQVDASDDSRPILQRLGFVAVTTTTPYIWTPPR